MPSVFNQNQLKILAVAALVAVSGLLAWGLVQPSRFEAEVPRFLLCAAISVYLSVFFFVFYPDRYELDTVPVLNLPVRVVGPVALWIIVFLLLWKVMPVGTEAGRLFSINANKPLYYPSNTTLELPDGTPLMNWQLVPDRNNPSVLFGVYISFPTGIAQYRTQFVHPGYGNAIAVFRRDCGENCQVTLHFR